MSSTILIDSLACTEPSSEGALSSKLLPNLNSAQTYVLDPNTTDDPDLLDSEGPAAVGLHTSQYSAGGAVRVQSGCILLKIGVQSGTGSVGLIIRVLDF